MDFSVYKTPPHLLVSILGGNSILYMEKYGLLNFGASLVPHQEQMPHSPPAPAALTIHARYHNTLDPHRVTLQTSQVQEVAFPPAPCISATFVWRQ